MKYKDIVIAKIHGDIDIKHGINVIEERGYMKLDELTSKPELLASFGEDSARHSINARLQGVSAMSNVSWVNAIVQGIDRSITLPLTGL